MTKMYMVFAACVFFVFCLLEMRGVAFDSNQTAPKPDIYTSRGGSSSRSSGGSFFYFSSK
jgi:hypothetical protein